MNEESLLTDILSWMPGNVLEKCANANKRWNKAAISDRPWMSLYQNTLGDFQEAAGRVHRGSSWRQQVKGIQYLKSHVKAAETLVCDKLTDEDGDAEEGLFPKAKAWPASSSAPEVELLVCTEKIIAEVVKERIDRGGKVVWADVSKHTAETSQDWIDTFREDCKSSTVTLKDDEDQPYEDSYHTGNVTSIVILKDHVVVGSEDKQISVWNLDGTLACENLFGGAQIEAEPVQALIQVPGRAMVLSGGSAGQLVVWDITTMKLVRELPRQTRIEKNQNAVRTCFVWCTKLTAVTGVRSY